MTENILPSFFFPVFALQLMLFILIYLGVRFTEYTKNRSPLIKEEIEEKNSVTSLINHLLNNPNV